MAKPSIQFLRPSGFRGRCFVFHCLCLASRWSSRRYMNRPHFTTTIPTATNSMRQNIPKCRSVHCLSSAEILNQERLWLPDDTYTYMLGYYFGTDPQPADVLLLHGKLGAGKTSFARGYIHAAVQDKSIPVTSPTFLLTNTYVLPKGKVPLTVYHMDLWRLNNASERPIVDFDEVFRNNISLIEWPDRLKALQPSQCLNVYLEYPSQDNISQSVNENDPWGFESNDTSFQIGRHARVIGSGDQWSKRVRSFYNDFVQKQHDGLYTLTLS